MQTSRIPKITLLLLIAIFPETAAAIPPPDFLFNIGASLFQAFSLILIFLSAIFVSIKQFARVYWYHIKNRKLISSIIIALIIATSLGGAYFYQSYSQEKAYQEWLAESQANTDPAQTTDTSLDLLSTESSTPAEITEIEVKPNYSPQESFIRQYYQDIATGNLEAAYQVSKKSVPLDTFKSWYQNTESIEVTQVQEIEKNKFSLRLTLKEKTETTEYATLMTLKETASGFQIQASEAKVISTKSNTSANISSSNTSQNQPNKQPAKQSNPASAITNSQFKQILQTNITHYLVLDAREDEEYEIGQFPNSIHIRFADLLAGEWIQLPSDKPIYVFCWSGIRGKEVAEFLASKGLNAHYIENGANGWVAAGGTWSGGIKFIEKHPEERFQKLYTTPQVKTEQANGTIIVDSRNKLKYNSWHIPNSINIPIIYTTSSQMQSTLSQVPPNSKVITVCDDFISCFDAKLAGLKLERQGHTFLGRYNKPWEYRTTQ